jgi:phosphoglycolate phosphatase
MNDLWNAVLFDLDGTLVDSFSAIAASANYVRESHGLAPLSQDDVRPLVGHGLRRLVERAVPIGNLEENCQVFAQHHPTVLKSGTHVLPGVLRLLGLLRDQKIRMGVCSNKPLALTLRLLDEMELAPYFDVVLGPESVTHPKPHPDMLYAAMKSLGTTADRTLYIGDMTVDIQTARSAEVPIWTVATGSQTEDDLRIGGATRTFPNMEEVVQALERESLEVAGDRW